MLSVATNCLVCAGYDLIEWLMDRLCIEDSRKLLLTQNNTELELEVSTVSMFVAVEAVHLANLLCQFGYYFPVSEQKNLLVKDDSSLYRFQVLLRHYQFHHNFAPYHDCHHRHSCAPHHHVIIFFDIFVTIFS